MALLKPKMLAFANHYLTGETLAKSYQLAGHEKVTDKVASVRAAEWMRRDDVQAYIREQQMVTVKETQVTREWMTEAHLESWSRAVLAGNEKAVVANLTRLAKIHGFDVAPAENLNPFKNWTADELARFKGIIRAERGSTDSAGSVH